MSETIPFTPEQYEQFLELTTDLDEAITRLPPTCAS